LYIGVEDLVVTEAGNATTPAALKAAGAVQLSGR